MKSNRIPCGNDILNPEWPEAMWDGWGTMLNNFSLWVVEQDCMAERISQFPH